MMEKWHTGIGWTEFAGGA